MLYRFQINACYRNTATNLKIASTCELIMANGALWNLAKIGSDYGYGLLSDGPKI